MWYTVEVKWLLLSAESGVDQWRVMCINDQVCVHEGVDDLQLNN